MDNSEMVSGSCLCGQNRFEIKGAFESFYFCHCTHCRKDSGSAHAANLFSTKAELIWKQGGNQIVNFNLPGTQHHKAFCPTCGSGMPNLQMGGQLLVVPAGSLDSHVTTTPSAHIFYASRANWDHELEKVAKIDALPGN